MKKMWNWMLIVMVAMFFLAPIFASATEGTRITTGDPKFTYFKVGLNMRKMLGKTTQVIPSKGSVENLDRLMADEADIGIVQKDAFAWYVQKHPEAEDAIEELGPLYEECVYIAVNSNGIVQNEDDLQSEGVNIAIGKSGSGSAVTWDYMRQLEPGYQKAGVSFKTGVRTLGKLASNPKGKINAVMWTSKPNLNGQMAQTVLNSKNLEFIDIDDKDLNDNFKDTGEPIYRFETIKSSDGFFGGSVKTICVDAIVVGRSEANEDILDNVANIVMNYKQSIIVTN